MIWLALLLSLVVVVGFVRIGLYFIADWFLMTRPPLPPLRAWQLSTDHCRRPMARPLDAETLEPIGDWRKMPRFSGFMQVKNGVLYARV